MALLFDWGKNSVLQSAALIRLDNNFYGDSDRRMALKEEERSPLILQPFSLPLLPLLAEFIVGPAGKEEMGLAEPQPQHHENREEDSGLITSIQSAFLLERQKTEAKQSSVSNSER